MIAAALAVALGISMPHAAAQTASPPPACLDFASQDEAQTFYEAEGGPQRDPHGLDPDRDGRACSAETASATATPTTAGLSPTATSTNDGLPRGSERSLLAWLGIALAVAGVAAIAISIVRRRRQPPPSPPRPPRLDLDELGW